MLDGAVLVISAVEGVQAQTRVLMRALHRLRIPTLLFVNKIDRGGAQDERVLRDIGEKLTPAIVAMGRCASSARAMRRVRAVPRRATPRFAAAQAELLADHDDALLAAYVDDETGAHRAPAARRAGRADAGAAGAPGVLRLRDHRRGRATR